MSFYKMLKFGLRISYDNPKAIQLIKVHDESKHIRLCYGTINYYYYIEDISQGVNYCVKYSYCKLTQLVLYNAYTGCNNDVIVEQKRR